MIHDYFRATGAYDAAQGLSDLFNIRSYTKMTFKISHKLRKEEMEEQFNREAKEGWRFAADAAKITDERASSEDRKLMSGGVFVAVDSNLGAVVGAGEGATERRKNRPSMGERARRYAGLFRVFLALRMLDAEE